MNNSHTDNQDYGKKNETGQQADGCPDSVPFDSLLIQTEISRHRHEEKKLESLIQAWRTAFDAIAQAVVLVDLNCIVLRCNKVMANFLGKSFPDILGNNLFELLEETFESQCDFSMAHQPDTPPKAHFEFHFGDNWYDMIWDPFVDNQGVLIGRVYIFSNITEQKIYEEQILRNQEQLRLLAIQLSLAEQKEHQKIALIIHETLGQSLALSKLRLDSIRGMVTDPEIRSSLDEIHELTVQSINYTRSLCFELSPPLLNELGLPAAIDWLLGSLEKKHGIIINIIGDYHSIRISDNISGFIYRVINELLMNVVKHAQTDNADLSISCDGNQIDIEVKDNGAGFDAGRLAVRDEDPGHFGLYGLRERLYALGGQIEIISNYGTGTTVHVKMPVSHEASSEGHK